MDLFVFGLEVGYCVGVYYVVVVVDGEVVVLGLYFVYGGAIGEGGGGEGFGIVFCLWWCDR